MLWIMTDAILGLQLRSSVTVYTNKAISTGAGPWSALNIFLKLSRSVLELREAKKFAPDQTGHSRDKSHTQMCWAPKFILLPFFLLSPGFDQVEKTSHFTFHVYQLLRAMPILCRG